MGNNWYNWYIGCKSLLYIALVVPRQMVQDGTKWHKQKF